MQLPPDGAVILKRIAHGPDLQELPLSLWATKLLRVRSWMGAVSPGFFKCFHRNSGAESRIFVKGT